MDSLQLPILLFVQLQNDATLQVCKNQLLVSDHDKSLSKPAHWLTLLSLSRSVSHITSTRRTKLVDCTDVKLAKEIYRISSHEWGSSGWEIRQ